MPESADSIERDPQIIDWSAQDLPDTWADKALLNPRGWWRLLRRSFGGRHNHIEYPEGLPLNIEIPRYVRQEFHNIPNGNFSNRLTRGYTSGFDGMMLGTLHKERREIAAMLAGSGAVLDLGCAGGPSTKALVDAGIADVWGLDVSPYLLQVAQQQVPGATFVQGLAEQTGFPADRFDAVVCCFLFHELPSKFADQALVEIKRILRPGGRLVILEPSPQQYHLGFWAVLRRWGIKAVYFWAVAKWIYEPFVAAWHRRDVSAWLSDAGFSVAEDRDAVPARRLIADLPSSD